GRPVRLGLAAAALVVVGSLPIGRTGRTVHRDRSFFGVVQVVRDETGAQHRLVHGDTTHGAQSTDPRRRREPLTYFHRSGPAGQALTELPGASRSRVAVIGLGTGSLACYGEPGQRWTFYEIDPGVERVARDRRLFTYLEDCPTNTDVVLGDARLSLTRAPDRHFSLVVLDAFSSDAIPVHLLTRQAFDVYLDKLADGGVLAAHVTNRYLDLPPVLGDLARDAGLTAVVRRDLVVTDAERDEGKSGSVWVLMARRPADLVPLTADPRWEPLRGAARPRVWTDDFSNIVTVLDWG
ncbi:MAG: fused MFS/spermidine synthase, partial [Actinomycetota bacterium]|nr:fused MFS/spermidine synthase [Actinomycetota bacterium]